MNESLPSVLNDTALHYHRQGRAGLLFRCFQIITVCCLLVVFVSTASLAQNMTIRGKVIDSADRQAIPGVSVLVKGTQKGTSTGTKGTFTLIAPQGSTLIVSYIGYKRQELVAAENMNIRLASNAGSLSELVVIGYGTTRKRDLISSVASISSKNFNKGQINSPDQLLQGKVSGLEITTNSGAPGAASTVVIRGHSSLRANDAPLYVVDGVPLDGRTAVPPLTLSSGGYGTSPDVNPLLYINPNDIAQVDVLKDASATAIYGSRGANGIVIITTKRPIPGQTRLEFATSFSSNIGYMKKYKVFNAASFLEAQKKLGTPQTDSGAVTDALKAITQKSLSQNYNVALSGGSVTGKYRASFLASITPGFIRNTSLKKYIGSFTGQYKFLKEKLSLDFSAIAGHVTLDQALIGNTAGANGQLITYALNWNPTSPLYKNGGFNLLSSSIPNPVAITEGYHDRSEVDNYLASLSAGYKILPNLEYKFVYSINHGVGTRNANIDGWLPLQGTQGVGLAAIISDILTSETFSNTLNYHAKLAPDLSLEAIAGYEYYRTNYSTTVVSATGFPTNQDQFNRSSILYTSIFQSGANQTPLAANADPNVEIQSFFGRANLSFLDKYYLVATLRDDGSNKFGKKNKYGLFPSLGAKWNISRESFLMDNKVLSNLSLRASWGITGSQSFPAGLALEQYSFTSSTANGQADVPNPHLKWEKTTQYNVGLDFAFFAGRIYGNIDYYNKNTTDLLFGNFSIPPAPNVIYYLNLPVDLRNKGAELTVGAQLIKGKDLNWDIDVNASYNKNRLTNYNGALIPTGVISGPGVSGSLSQAIANNQPADVYYLKPFKGFDAKGQQIIGDAPVFAGDPNPHVLAGMSTTLGYKKFSLTVNGSGAFGYKIYNNTYNTITPISVLAKGQNAATYSLGTGESVTDGTAASTRYLESGNYFKLRNASLQYTVGDIGKVLRNLRVFVGATNLFVITKFRGFDPEVNVDKNNNGFPSRNIEYAPYPTPRTLTMGLNVSL